MKSCAIFGGAFPHLEKDVSKSHIVSKDILSFVSAQCSDENSLDLTRGFRKLKRMQIYYLIVSTNFHTLDNSSSSSSVR